jgi:hypothetical protein
VRHFSPETDGDKTESSALSAISAVNDYLESKLAWKERPALSLLIEREIVVRPLHRSETRGKMAPPYGFRHQKRGAFTNMTFKSRCKLPSISAFIEGNAMR